ncbi:MAG: type II secretion system protein [Planctomycetota bacterium]|jgi:prepilin-type N-terminal cleavage/methylation domain-containing protein
MQRSRGFTLVELMVTVLIFGILAAVAIPIMRGRVDSGKWTEANTTAGAIKSAVRAYIAEKGPAYDYSNIEGRLDTVSIYEELGFSSADLAGAYFNQADYEVKNVTADPPSCVIEVRSTHAQGPWGMGTLAADGSWSVN